MYEIQGYLLLWSFSNQSGFSTFFTLEIPDYPPSNTFQHTAAFRKPLFTAEVSCDCFTELEYYNVSSLIWFSELLATHPRDNIHSAFVPFHCVYSQSF